MIWSTHLTDLDPLGSARRFAEFLGEIVAAASVSVIDRWKDSALRCRRRPKHRPCPGRIRVMERGDGCIEWMCPTCGDRGYIYSWQGSLYDLSALREAGDGRRLRVVLTEQEYDEVKKSLVLEQEQLGIVFGATNTAEGVVLRATAEELDGLAGQLAFEANHASNRGRQRVLDQVVDRIEGLLARSGLS